MPFIFIVIRVSMNSDVSKVTILRTMSVDPDRAPSQ